jgi:hypothetical protein
MSTERFRSSRREQASDGIGVFSRRQDGLSANHGNGTVTMIDVLLITVFSAHLQDLYLTNMRHQGFP